MSDLLLRLGRSPGTWSVLKSLGVSLPTPLRRAGGPWTAAPLTGRSIGWLTLGASSHAEAAVPTLRAAGARVGLMGAVDGSEGLRALDAQGSVPNEHGPLNGLVIEAPADDSFHALHALQSLGPALIARLAPCARIVFLAPPEGGAPEHAALSAALGGVMRSLAKEVGRRGATANLLRVAPDGARDTAELLLWLLSDRLAFVDGQELRVASTHGTSSTRSLAGKTAVVTGSARGIGAATARALADLGAHVICVDRDQEQHALDTLVRRIGGTALTCDVTDPDAGHRIVEASGATGGLDVVVHNAGITRDRTFARMTEDRWRAVLDVNLGAILRMHAAMEPSIRPDGRVLGLASVAGIAGNPGQTAYAGSKAGVMGWVRAAAPSLAHRRITINAVAPGFIETDMTAKMPTAIREAARRLSSLNQGGSPDDVAQTVAFLASPAAAGISGQTLRVCGGALIGA
jgi:3-oxoacyl-[acyl-carrier protein] reductase